MIYELKPLVGQTITKISFFPDDLVFLELADHRVVALEAVGECCDHSWFEHIDIPEPEDALITEVQVSTEDVCGENMAFDIRLVTDKGDLVLEFRNDRGESGYYRGELAVTFLDEAIGGHKEMLEDRKSSAKELIAGF